MFEENDIVKTLADKNSQKEQNELLQASMVLDQVVKLSSQITMAVQLGLKPILQMSQRRFHSKQINSYIY